MNRTVAAEWLDELPANDPLALGSRRDLQRLNFVMGHARLLCEALATRLDGESPKRIVELGAGDGNFLLSVAKKLSIHWPKVEAVLVDCKDAVSQQTREEFATLGWSVKVAESDVFEWLRSARTETADVVVANLFLHQFPQGQLAEMLALAASRTRMFAACEPERAALPLTLSRLVGFIGCNAVTRHDAPASVRAGFSGKEISALWPKSAAWQLSERRVNLLTHIFVARCAAQAESHAR